MSVNKLHADEAEIGVTLVRRLLTAQFPQWEGLGVRPVISAGTDNAIYRLGIDMALRPPRIPGAARQVDKEQRWLPELASYLPLNVPVPFGKGLPAEGYAWNWSVYT